MILHPPFTISARLLPALKIGESYLSWDGEDFFIDAPDFQYVIDDFGPGAGADTQECFHAILDFLYAAVESRKYRERTERTGENEDLFPAHIVDWAVDHNDEIGCLMCDLEENSLIEEDES